jgi:hypothetical protein
MRPHGTLRALGAGMALGAITLTSFVVDGGSPARAQAAAPDAPVADVAITDQRLNVMAGRRAVVRGHIATAGAGQAVRLQRRSGGRWGTIDRATTAGDGAFRLTFRPRVTGSAPVRVRAGGAGEPVGRLNVYRHAHASWYGPGLFGSKLGCGGRLAPDTLGVAHKSLPCGSRVTLRHGGRIVRVRVVDRGPYVGGREFDLTAATKQRLGFSGVGTILVAHA